MPLDEENLEQPSGHEEPQGEQAATPTAPPELVPGRHLVRVWDRNTNKAIEVNRSIDTGNTLDIWI